MAWVKSGNFFRKFLMSSTRRICLIKYILSKIPQLEKLTMRRFELRFHLRKINILTIRVNNQMLMNIQHIIFTDKSVLYHTFFKLRPGQQISFCLQCNYLPISIFCLANDITNISLIYSCNVFANTASVIVLPLKNSYFVTRCK